MSHPEPINATSTHADAAIKADDNKARYDLILPESIDMLAQVFAYGIRKYGIERNCEKGFSYGRLFAAACRHMWAFWRGEELDPESGLPHLAHAQWNIHILLAQTIRKTGKDTRWTYGRDDSTSNSESVQPSECSELQP